MVRWCAVLVAAWTAFPSVAAAQDPDPPGRVARISYLAGTVSLRAADDDEWAQAALNYPVSLGDHLWTDRGSRGELDLGTAFVRAAPLTEFSVIDLDDQVAQIRLTQGSLALRVRSLDPDEIFEIDTPGGAITIVRPGFYRIDVAETGDAATLSVRNGEADVSTSASTYQVRARESVAIDGLQQVSLLEQAARPDDFEDWCLARDRRVQTSESGRYVSADMIGYADLDQYGNWEQNSEYGSVWVPQVAAEWVPYREGHWVWIRPWGWTWVDDAPWGFAPFHYGRWVRWRGDRWAWVPGRVVARPVYAPALVAFVGGSGWSASMRIGEPVAWFPLGPREPYIPAYRVSERYVRTVNVSHVAVTSVNVTNITYVNRDVPGAVTAVSREDFVRARPVGRVGVAVPRDAVRMAPAATAAPGALAPVRHEGRAAAAAAPPEAAVNRRVVMRHAPHSGSPAAQGGPAVPAPAAAAPAPPAPPAHGDDRRQNERRPPPPPGTVSPPPGPPPPPPPVHAAPHAAPPAAPEHTVPPPAPPVAPPPPAPAPHAAPPPPAHAAPPPEPPPPSHAAPPPPAHQAPPPPPHQAPDQRNDAALAARHAQERASLDSRQAAERAELQARQRQEEQNAHDGHARQALQQRHQQEQHALQERQRQEREAVQKRQENERRK